MSRPYDWSPLGWGSDPVPGDPGTVATTAMKYRATAQAVSDASSNLSHLDMSENKSLGLTTVLDQIKAVRKQLDDVESRVDGAAAALESYGPKLGEAQRLSLEALSAAEFAKQAAQSSQTRRDDAANDYYATNDPAQRSVAKDRYNAYNSRVASANQDLALAKAKLKQAMAMRDEAAGTATSALRSIDQSSPVRDTAMDHIHEFLNKLLDFWDTHIAPWLDDVCNILDIASLVLTIVAFVLTATGVGIGAAGVLFALAQGISWATRIARGVKLAVSGLKVIEGRIAPAEFGKDALMFGVSLALGKFTKSMSTKSVARQFAKAPLKISQLEEVLHSHPKIFEEGVEAIDGAIGQPLHVITDLARDALGRNPKGTNPQLMNTYRRQVCGTAS